MTDVLLVGGPGNISRGTVDYLLERGYHLAIYTRNTEAKQRAYPDVHFYEGDRHDQESLGRALNASRAELVIDTICYELAQAKALYELTKDKIRHLLFISTVDTYGYPLSRLPYREGVDPVRPTIGDYAQKKRSIELFFADKYHKEAYPVTIGRPSLSIGPGFCPMMFGDWGHTAVPRMEANRPILVPGDGNGLMHVGWGYDVGRMAGRIIGDGKAIGLGYTLSDPDCITRDDYISLFTDYLGTTPERVYIPQAVIEGFPGVEGMAKINHLYRMNMAFSLEAFKRDFPDYQWLPLAQGVAEFIEVNRQRNAFPALTDEIVDDTIIRQWKRLLVGFGRLCANRPKP